MVVRGWLVNVDGLVGGESYGLVDLWARQALGFEELYALCEGGILGLVEAVSRERRGRGRLAFGSDKKATAFLNASCLSMVALDSHSAPATFFYHPSRCFSLRTVMFRLAAQRAVAGSSRRISLHASRYARYRTTTCVPSPSPSIPAFSFGQSSLFNSIPFLPPAAGRRSYADVATKFSRTKPHMNIGTIGKLFSPPPGAS